MGLKKKRAGPGRPRMYLTTSLCLPFVVEYPSGENRVAGGETSL